MIPDHRTIRFEFASEEAKEEHFTRDEWELIKTRTPTDWCGHICETNPLVVHWSGENFHLLRRWLLEDVIPDNEEDASLWLDEMDRWSLKPPVDWKWKFPRWARDSLEIKSMVSLQDLNRKWAVWVSDGTVMGFDDIEDTEDVSARSVNIIRFDHQGRIESSQVEQVRGRSNHQVNYMLAGHPCTRVLAWEEEQDFNPELPLSEQDFSLQVETQGEVTFLRFASCRDPNVEHQQFAWPEFGVFPFQGVIYLVAEGHVQNTLRWTQIEKDDSVIINTFPGSRIWTMLLTKSVSDSEVLITLHCFREKNLICSLDFTSLIMSRLGPEFRPDEEPQIFYRLEAEGSTKKLYCQTSRFHCQPNLEWEYFLTLWEIEVNEVDVVTSTLSSSIKLTPTLRWQHYLSWSNIPSSIWDTMGNWSRPSIQFWVSPSWYWIQLQTQFSIFSVWVVNRRDGIMHDLTPWWNFTSVQSPRSSKSVAICDQPLRYIYLLADDLFFLQFPHLALVVQMT